MRVSLLQAFFTVGENPYLWTPKKQETLAHARVSLALALGAYSAPIFLVPSGYAHKASYRKHSRSA